MTWLPPWWEVRTKVSYDALTSVVGASKPTLKESFDSRADIFISSDEDSKPIVSQRSEPQPNRYHRTEEQGLRYNLIGSKDRVLIEPLYSPSCRYCSEFGRVRKQGTLCILLKGFVPCACISDPLRTSVLRASYGVGRLRLLRAEKKVK